MSENAAIHESRNTGLTRPWWLLGLPLGYLLHLADEWWGGDGFVVWIERATGAVVSPTRFLILNGIVWPLACALTFAAILRPKLAWFPVTFATVLLINAALHLLGTLYTATYSPGLATALLFYLPFGTSALRQGRRLLPPESFGWAALAGILVHGLVIVAAFA